MGDSAGVKTWGPFTGRQLTTIIVVVAAALLLPSTVWAVDTFSNVAIEDPVSGVKAKVGTGRALVVGDGSGNLTVDGTVKVAAPVTSQVGAPVKVDLSAPMAAGSGSISQSPYTVPAGQNFVVTYVSGYFARSFGDNTALAPRFVLVTFDGAESVYAPLTSVNPAFYSFSTPIHGLATNNVGLAAARDNSTGGAYVHVVLDGYLVPEPPAAASASTASTPPSGGPATSPQG